MKQQNSIVAAQDFLRQTRMDPGAIDMETGVGIFLDEMESGLAGRESSLKMLPTYISPVGDVPANTPVLVLDAGGTNFRVARVSFSPSGEAEIKSFVKHPMPGTRGPVDRDTFFNTIVDYMANHLNGWNEEYAPTVGFCFSYPTEIYPDGEGRLVHFTKEVRAPEVEGQLIVSGLNEALKSRGFPTPRSTVLLNDTVATLLAGKVASALHGFDGYIGFILGTGTNCAYIEHNERIGKLPSPLAGESQVINIESGGLNRITGGDIDDLFDESTDNPGHYRFEKMVSGAYLGPLAGRVLMEAVRGGIFSEKAGEELRKITAFDTIIVDNFLQSPMDTSNPIGAACTESGDRASAYVLLDAMIDRAAKLAAVNLSATALREGGGKDPSLPLAICADGTTFYKTKDLLFRTRYYLHRYLKGERGISFELIHRDDAPVIGSAVAALLLSVKKSSA